MVASGISGFRLVPICGWMLEETWMMWGHQMSLSTPSTSSSMASLIASRWVQQDNNKALDASVIYAHLQASSGCYWELSIARPMRLLVTHHNSEGLCISQLLRTRGDMARAISYQSTALHDLRLPNQEVANSALRMAQRCLKDFCLSSHANTNHRSPIDTFCCFTGCAVS